MLDFNIVYYCHSRCMPFYRFKDFINYYPRRIKTEKWLYNWFIKAGGEPKMEHPLYFVLEGSDYLNEWFDKGRIIKIPLSIINEKHISFTIGDSNVINHKGIKKETLKKYIEKTYGWKEIYQKENYRKSFNVQDKYIIEFNSKKIGWLNYVENKDNIEIHQIFILPKYQNKGIGSTILTEIINTGESKKKSIILQVLKSNAKAIKLYSKLGFNVYAQTDTHIKLINPPTLSSVFRYNFS